MAKLTHDQALAALHASPRGRISFPDLVAVWPEARLEATPMHAILAAPGPAIELAFAARVDFLLAALVAERERADRAEVGWRDLRHAVLAVGACIEAAP